MRAPLALAIFLAMSTSALAQTQQKAPPKAPAQPAPQQQAAPQQEPPGPPQVHVLYTLGYVAKSKCQPNVPVPIKFMSNYQIVFFKAAQALQEGKPGASLEAAAKYLLTQSFNAANALAAEIDKTGCDTPKVKQILQIQQQTEGAPDLLNPPPQ